MLPPASKLVGVKTLKGFAPCDGIYRLVGTNRPAPGLFQAPGTINSPIYTYNSIITTNGAPRGVNVSDGVLNCFSTPFSVPLKVPANAASLGVAFSIIPASTPLYNNAVYFD